jgi:hypothetical protein
LISAASSRSLRSLRSDSSAYKAVHDRLKADGALPGPQHDLAAPELAKLLWSASGGGRETVAVVCVADGDSDSSRLEALAEAALSAAGVPGFVASNLLVRSGAAEGAADEGPAKHRSMLRTPAQLAAAVDRTAARLAPTGEQRPRCGAVVVLDDFVKDGVTLAARGRAASRALDAPVVAFAALLAAFSRSSRVLLRVDDGSSAPLPRAAQPQPSAEGAAVVGQVQARIRVQGPPAAFKAVEADDGGAIAAALIASLPPAAQRAAAEGRSLAPHLLEADGNTIVYKYSGVATVQQLEAAVGDPALPERARRTLQSALQSARACPTGEALLQYVGFSEDFLRRDREHLSPASKQTCDLAMAALRLHGVAFAARQLWSHEDIARVAAITGASAVVVRRIAEALGAAAAAALPHQPGSLAVAEPGFDDGGQEHQRLARIAADLSRDLAARQRVPVAVAKLYVRAYAAAARVVGGAAGDAGLEATRQELVQLGYMDDDSSLGRFLSALGSIGGEGGRACVLVCVRVCGGAGRGRAGLGWAGLGLWTGLVYAFPGP